MTRFVVACFALLLVACGSRNSTPQPAAVDSEPPLAHESFPLRTDPQLRHLVDARGRPYFLQGDAAWSLIGRLTREQIIEYLDDRAQRGFNAVIVNLIEHEFTDHPPDNAYGEPPFLEPDDFSTPNERYFAHAEFALVEAERRGLVVMLAPAYLGYEGGSQGWYSAMEEQDLDDLRSYGRFVAQRFANRRNIIWVQGGDYDPPDFETMRVIAEGIREVDSRSLSTFHGARNSIEMNRRSPQPAWLTLANVYTAADNVVPSALAQYQRSATPFILIEAAYDALGVDSNGVRREAYQAVFSGACGHVIGHDHIWRFSPGWRPALDTSATRSLRYLPELLATVRWPDLVPDAPGSFVVAGADKGALAAASSRSADHHRAVVYVPERRTMTVDLEALAGKHVKVRTFDPASGEFAELPDSPWVRHGPRQVAPPERLGGPDWVVVFEGGA